MSPTFSQDTEHVSFIFPFSIVYMTVYLGCGTFYGIEGVFQQTSQLLGGYTRSKCMWL